MSRSRCHLLTINNYQDTDFEDILSVILEYQPKYWIIGYEVGEECETPHIHCFIWFRHQITANSINNKIPRANNQLGDSDTHTPYNYMMYCKGYEKYDKHIKKYGRVQDNDNFLVNEHECARTDYSDYSFKNHQCENQWHDDGEAPIAVGVAGGKATSATSTKIIDAIKEGKTMEELRNLFPSFMMYHTDKVIKWKMQFNRRKTNLYHIKDSKLLPKLQTIYPDLIVITDLWQLDAYDEWENIAILVSDTDFPPKGYEVWQYGPITYKVGVRINSIYPDNLFMIYPHNIKGFKRISNIDLDTWLEGEIPEDVCINGGNEGLDEDE